MGGAYQIKVVTRVQVKTARVKKSYKAEERRQWRKFGDCAGLEPGEMGANVTFTTTDDVLLERKKQSSEEEKSVDMFSNLCTSCLGSNACTKMRKTNISFNIAHLL
jgi:hypothetical protein